jgi:hypothetical protein
LPNGNPLVNPETQHWLFPKNPDKLWLSGFLFRQAEAPFNLPIME